jgi:hypothetical protein
MFPMPFGVGAIPMARRSFIPLGSTKEAQEDTILAKAPTRQRGECEAPLRPSRDASTRSGWLTNPEI